MSSKYNVNGWAKPSSVSKLGYFSAQAPVALSEEVVPGLIGKIMQAEKARTYNYWERS